MIVSKKIIYIQIIGIILYISQFIPILNYISTAGIFLAIVFFYWINKCEYSLFFMLLYSGFALIGINIYTFKILGVNLFYISLLFLLFISLVKNRKLIIDIPKVLFLYMIIVAIVFIFSIFNVFDSTIYFFKDFVLLVVVPSFIVILFKDIETKKIMSVFYHIVSIRIITSVIMYATGLTLSINKNMFNIIMIDNYDELSAFYFLLLLGVILFKKIKYNKWVFLLFLISILGVAKYGIAFAGLGSQSIILVVIVFGYFAIKKKWLFIFLLTTSIIIFNSVSISITNKALNYKLKNITELLDNLNEESIYLIPHSPQVRVIELINILSSSWYNVIFGHGFGGYFTDVNFEFNKYIGRWDFSNKEIELRQFYNPHNVGFSLLKFGILLYLFLFYLFYRIINIPDDNIKMFLILSLLYLSMNVGFGIKASFLFGIVLIIVNNERKILS